MIRKTLMGTTLAGKIALGTFAAGALALGVIVAPIVAHANDRDEAKDEAALVTKAKITLGQAVATAEQQSGGKAWDAGIEERDGTAYFEVRVVKDGARQKLLIDPQTGKVTKTVTADNRRDEHHDDD